MKANLNRVKATSPPNLWRTHHELLLLNPMSNALRLTNMMSRHYSAVCPVIAGLLAMLGALHATEQTKPNLLVILTDQQRIDDMSCAGNPWVKTPAVDSLAARGTRFTRSYCANPLCVPSRASLATSRMPYELCKESEEHIKGIPKGIVSTGPLFRKAGYQTVWTGKWHMRTTYPKPESEGGDLPGFEVLTNASLPVNAIGVNQPRPSTGGGTKWDAGFADAAVSFLREKHSRPFLLTVSLLNPHDICSGQSSSEMKLPGEAERLPPAPSNLNSPNLTITPDEGPHPPKGRVDKWPDISLRQRLYRYYRYTEESDQLIGEVLAALEETGLETNTVVVFTSDHGEMNGSHHVILKSVPYEEALAVPFVIAGPGIPAGAVDKTHLVSGLDMLPTLCGLAGITPPADARGFSILPILNNPAAPWREAVYAAVDGNQQRLVRTERYKYISINRPKDNELLFDMQNDPGETQNLANEPALSPVLARHRALLEDWMGKTSDPFLAMTKK